MAFFTARLSTTSEKLSGLCFQTLQFSVSPEHNDRKWEYLNVWSASKVQKLSSHSHKLDETAWLESLSKDASTEQGNQTHDLHNKRQATLPPEPQQPLLYT